MYVVAEGLVEVPTSGCEASFFHSTNFACERAIDRLPGTDWATSGEVVNCWIKVSECSRVVLVDCSSF